MYRQQQDANTGAEQQYQQLSAGSSLFNFSPFSQGSLSGISGPSFQNSPQHLTPPSARPAVARQPSQPRQTPTEPQGLMGPPSSAISPRFSDTTPVRNNSVSFTPHDRSLPQRNVTPDTITVAYVAFILYCNPSFPLDTDATKLRTDFQTPPKSDNKDFETFRLFELIQKFDAKEIKTWGQLARDLGVEAPDVSKGQSVQKVQQYSVRLKRWMRAMHVDAFFEYLLGNDHAYFTDVPHPSDPYPAEGRDGVLAEEDLAIRALDPSFRPKRGRRRNSEAEQEDEAEVSNKQPRMMESNSYAQPQSAHPAGMLPFSANQEGSNDPWTVASAVTPQSFAPWARKPTVAQSAIATSAPSRLRWQLHGSSQNAGTPHPMTAQPTLMGAHIEAALGNESKSAVTPTTRKRRKHGPAVSSAWPSAIAPGSKPRGRPPASRNLQDGPFTTFPADPANNKSNGPTFAAPIAPIDAHPSREEQQMSQAPPPVIERQSEGPGRPGRLSLQVPHHAGGPVRLATPPRVLVNGENNDSEKSMGPTPVNETAPQLPSTQLTTQRPLTFADRDIPGFAFDVLKRVLTSDLLRADLVGRRQRLSGDEAKRLADVVLERFNVPREDTNKPRDDIARLTAASWLGVGDQLNVPLGPARGRNKRVTVTRFRVDVDGYEEIVSAHDENLGDIRDVFDLSWNVTMGGCNGSFEIKGLTLSGCVPPPDDSHDTIIDLWTDIAKQVGGIAGSEELIQHGSREWTSNYSGNRGAVGEDGIDWKSKYLALEFGSKMAKGEMVRIRERLVEMLLDVLI